ncbi:uncharacterized protein [Pocillopora verrucosa]|uniref:Uncharacterized protein n=1 Tax=Pocillopora meandrina TaxID=46732 RepID=A0AAU9WCU3_9CNID|nr:uncharacterized protein LOC131798638 [Pocillopora verrucosa]CAH3110315.1 unnamed protein product [Pocillopora meandrina]
MKVLAGLLLFVAFTASYKIPDEQEREKRFIFGKCDADTDCGVERCCSVIGTCHNKRGLNQSCNFSGLHKCGCKSGLTCQPVFSIGSLPIYHRCKPAPTEEPGSGDLQ